VEPILTATGVTAGYSSAPAIRDVSLQLRAGEVVALLGANGAGKSTTLGVLCGALKPTSGSLTWKGEQLTGPTHRRAKAGLRIITEERSVFMSLSVRDNLRLGSGGIDAALEIFPELKRLLRRKAGLLSGGEQQMLTLARALAGRPDALLTDELSLGLSPVAVERLLAAIQQAASRGIGVILVEQQLRTALSVADRAYVMRRGQIVMQGSGVELRTRQEEIRDFYLSGKVTRADNVTDDGGVDG
jgi:branched-chain amino acid transport system ATP-binding protein